MKFPKNERVVTKLLSHDDELEYVITQSLTDPPKFTLYKIEGGNPTKLKTSKDPMELREIWIEEKPARKRKE